MLTSTDFDPIINQDQAAQAIGRSKKTLWRWWAKEKCFPKPIIVNGRAIGWRKSVIDKFNGDA